jgi:hypothetical protein
VVVGVEGPYPATFSQATAKNKKKNRRIDFLTFFIFQHPHVGAPEKVLNYLKA